ncbi:Hypothetical predicted protein [Podarcis lilfordi]|uniref:Uncharacterized protein n=1 Tax=Podarcis lilfordi TaxID=74358 RepID=A0AA35L5K8_9SAUR|nr:Hypothetical predicted protein [Podarcis lilfordi]
MDIILSFCGMYSFIFVWGNKKAKADVSMEQCLLHRGEAFTLTGGFELKLPGVYETP